jgi:hypothetical protein
MRTGGGSGGFLGGAVLGLVLALLLAGVGSLFFRQGSSPQAPAQTEFAGGAAANSSAGSSSVTTSAAQQAQAGLSAPSQASSQGAGNGSSTSSSIASALTSTGGVLSQVQRPNSALSILPSEGIGTLVGTVAPLLVGLLAAAMVYGAYTRRQDSSS